MSSEKVVDEPKAVRAFVAAIISGGKMVASTRTMLSGGLTSLTD